VRLEQVTRFVHSRGFQQPSVEQDEVRTALDDCALLDGQGPLAHFQDAHELAHSWLGETALSNLDLAHGSTNAIERFCNAVAAEVLVPLALVSSEFNAQADLNDEVQHLARAFKVSTLVILRRLFDAKRLRSAAYAAAYSLELERLAVKATSGGGDFYLILGARASKRFALAGVTSTLEGRSPFTEAFRLLGFRKMSRFDEAWPKARTLCCLQIDDSRAGSQRDRWHEVQSAQTRNVPADIGNSGADHDRIDS
jgi:hypothetical protein